MRHTACTLALTAALLASGCRATPPEAADEEESLEAAGNVNNLYVLARARLGGEPGFFYWQRDARGAWHAGETANGEPVAVAAWRDDLFVFFDSGRFGLFGLGRPEVRPAPLEGFEPAAVCEDGLAVEAFGWDEGRNPVYARFEDGRWAVERMDVSLAPDRVRDPCAARYAGRCYVVWREEVPTLSGARPSFRLRFVYREDGRWTGPIPSRLYVASRAWVAADGERMICLFRAPDGGNGPGPWTVATYTTADEDWHEIGAVEGLGAEDSLAIARAGTEFFVVALDDRQPRVAPLDLEAARVGTFVPITARAGGDRLARSIWGDLFYAVAMVVMLIVMVRWQRRARLGRAAKVDEPEARDPMPAPLVRRAAAFVVDYLFLVTAVIVPVVSHVLPDLPYTGWPPPARDILILQGLWLAVSIPYFTLAEALTGQTLGKALFGLEVRRLAGGKPSLGAAFLRNVLRVVDEIPGPYLVGLISIIVGPRPQRLGDRAARTLVVLRRPSLPPSR